MTLWKLNILISASINYWNEWVYIFYMVTIYFLMFIALGILESCFILINSRFKLYTFGIWNISLTKMFWTSFTMNRKNLLVAYVNYIFFILVIINFLLFWYFTVKLFYFFDHILFQYWVNRVEWLFFHYFYINKIN